MTRTWGRNHPWSNFGEPQVEAFRKKTSAGKTRENAPAQKTVCTHGRTHGWRSRLGTVFIKRIGSNVIEIRWIWTANHGRSAPHGRSWITCCFYCALMDAHGRNMDGWIVVRLYIQSVTWTTPIVSRNLTPSFWLVVPLLAVSQSFHLPWLTYSLIVFFLPSSHDVHPPNQISVSLNQ